MFELFIATVLVDGSQSETALTYPSLLEFERMHNCSILNTMDNDLHAKHLATLAWLAHKQQGTVLPPVELGKTQKPWSLTARTYGTDQLKL